MQCCSSEAAAFHVLGALQWRLRCWQPPAVVVQAGLEAAVPFRQGDQ